MIHKREIPLLTYLKKYRGFLGKMPKGKIGGFTRIGAMSAALRVLIASRCWGRPGAVL